MTAIEKCEQILRSLRAQFATKVFQLEPHELGVFALRPDPMGKPVLLDAFLRDLAANAATGLGDDEDGGKS